MEILLAQRLRATMQQILDRNTAQLGRPVGAKESTGSAEHRMADLRRAELMSRNQLCHRIENAVGIGGLGILGRMEAGVAIVWLVGKADTVGAALRANFVPEIPHGKQITQDRQRNAHRIAKMRRTQNASASGDLGIHRAELPPANGRRQRRCRILPRDECARRRGKRKSVGKLLYGSQPCIRADIPTGDQRQLSQCLGAGLQLRTEVIQLTFRQSRKSLEVKESGKAIDFLGEFSAQSEAGASARLASAEVGVSGKRGSGTHRGGSQEFHQMTAFGENHRVKLTPEKLQPDGKIAIQSTAGQLEES